MNDLYGIKLYMYFNIWTVRKTNKPDNLGIVLFVNGVNGDGAISGRYG